nr:hypothetical protein BHI3_18090 [Bacteriovorax sp. HI3]
MTKKMLLIIYFSLTSIRAFSDDITIAQKEFYRNQLRESFQLFRDRKDLTSAEKLIQSVTNDQIAEFGSNGKLFDLKYCEDSCAKKGTSEIRTVLVKKIPSIELSSNTRECKQYCKGMLKEERAFLNGLTVGSAKAVSNDCIGAVNSSTLIKLPDTKIDNLSHKIPLTSPK